MSYFTDSELVITDTDGNPITEEELNNEDSWESIWDEFDALVSRREYLQG